MKQQQNCCIVSKEQGSLKTEKNSYLKAMVQKVVFCT